MFILRKKYQRGEIATLLTLISVGLMLAGIIAGTKLAKSPQTTKSNAAYPTGNLDGTVDNGSENPPAKCTDGSWTCGGVTANSAIRQLFCANWCDGQNQWLWEKARSELGDPDACGGKPSKPKSDNCPPPLYNTPTPH